MKNNYVLIHGSFGSPFVNWFPYLRKEIEKRDLEVYTPDFPTGVGYQNYKNWSKLLNCYVEVGGYTKRKYNYLCPFNRTCFCM